MKRYNVWLVGRFEQWDDHYNGKWCKWEDVSKETIPIPTVRIIDSVRVTDGGMYDPRDRWAVYLNNLCIGLHTDRGNAENQAEHIRFALGITQ